MSISDQIQAFSEAARKRHATRPARPEVDRAYEAARDALAQAVADRGGRWDEATTRYQVDSSGHLEVIGLAVPGAAFPDGFATAEPNPEPAEVPRMDHEPRPIGPPKVGRATDAQLASFEADYRAAGEAARADPCPATARAYGVAKRRFEAAIRTVGGRWKHYKLGRGGWLSREFEQHLHADAVKEAS